MTFETQCIRCGKTRVFFKKWTEQADGKGAKMTREIYVCPDRECQKIVDEKFDEIRKRRLDSEERKKSIHLKQK